MKSCFRMLLVGLTALLTIAPVGSAEKREGEARAGQSAVVPDCNHTNPATLAKNFVTPPDSCRPWVYAFFLNGNITRGGITADLEAMKKAGIGGMTVMEVDQGTPRGPVDFMSGEWRELFKHLVVEAGRLGLEVNMNNDAGWNGSGLIANLRRSTANREAHSAKISPNDPNPRTEP